jgi:hypothetical protein
MKIWILLFGCLVPAFCQAQSYSVTGSVVAGGGGTSSGGSYQVSGTIGQPEAGAAMSGGGYSLTGGFWSSISVIGPLLTISHTSTTVTISWPTTAGYTLQQNNNLASKASWVNSGYTVSTNNGTNSISITSPTGALFFRLDNP